jgi:hypothetical protein
MCSREGTCVWCVLGASPQYHPRVRDRPCVGPESDDETTMRARLLNTQRLPESVVTGDYVTIGRDADALSRITERR